MCIVLRSDLNMSKGKLIAQACHAAVEANEQGKKLKHKEWVKWKNEGAKKVALNIESLLELESLAEKAKERDIITVVIQDAGLTEIPPGSITAVGLGPDRSDVLDTVTGALPLIK